MRGFLVAVFAFALTAWVWPARGAPPPSALPGWERYERLCAPCHGASGDGRGPAAPYLHPAPRDFTQAIYKWRSTPVGAPPLDEDLAFTIRHGAPGTVMPDFALAPAEITELVTIVKAFGPPGAFVQPPPTTLAPPPPAADRAPPAALWVQYGCATCHGPEGRGNGAMMRGAPPYDFTTSTIHRPRASDDPAERKRAIVASITNGISGTSMPSHAELGPLVISDLADHVLALNAKVPPHSATGSVFERHAALPAIAASTMEADRDAPLVAGTWPGHGDDAVVFGAPVPPQGPPPANLAPAQASLSMRQCARCHAKQAREWTGSIHAGAASPGLFAQTEHALKGSKSDSCRRCHTPLAEQKSDRALAEEGITCAGCHVREWVRHGPPGVAASLLPIEGYPLKTMSLYQRGDFCMTCHQLPPRGAVAGKPLLDTYREWLTGPYMKRGVQCQHCHMPNREHTVRGIHDPDTVKQAYTLRTAAHATPDGDRRKVTISATLANTGAGHFFPTTPTPTVRVTIELLDEAGQAIASDTEIIGRAIEFREGAWRENADTRIAPGAERTIRRAWRTSTARAARLTIAVWPDALYESIYRTRLAGSLAAPARALYEQALRTAIGRRYVVERRTLTF